MPVHLRMLFHDCPLASNDQTVLVQRVLFESLKCTISYYTACKLFFQCQFRYVLGQGLQKVKRWLLFCKLKNLNGNDWHHAAEWLRVAVDRSRRRTNRRPSFYRHTQRADAHRNIQGKTALYIPNACPVAAMYSFPRHPPIKCSRLRPPSH